MAAMNRRRALLDFLFRRNHPTVVAREPGGSLDDVFAHIYRARLWGAPRPWNRTHSDFFSGPGSHEASVIKPYIAAVNRFLRSRHPMDAVDLGCGDFNIGRQIRNSCGRYIACDIVPALISHNQQIFANLSVDFRCLNIVTDPLPPGEIVFLRQVLQHLSNDHITRVVDKLVNYRFLVLTEHLPIGNVFTPNLDHQCGSGLRLSQNSGVVLTDAPFSMPVKSHVELCSVAHFGGVIRTDMYEL